MHNRLHPHFVDGFLEPLTQLPESNPLSNLALSVLLEIVLDNEGGITRVSVLRPSRVTAFDQGALDAINRAQPFGPPPSAVLSDDGLYYMEWELFREPTKACSIYFARPFLAKAQTK